MMADGCDENARRRRPEIDFASETSDLSDFDEPEPPVPPDGGYGWVIMIASFFCNVIVDGVCFSVGIFYLEFLPYYGESKSKTSWVGSVLNGMYLSMGPIVSGLANKFGCRFVTILGSFIATVAYILSIFSPNVDVLIVTYGILGGLGFGLMYLPAIVMVGYYFEKKRAFATGIAVCGSGIGAFTFAPMIQILMDSYGWKGAVLIMAGIVLNGMVMGALFRPLEASKKPKRQKSLMLRMSEAKKQHMTKCIDSMDNLVITRDNKLLRVSQLDMNIGVVDTSQPKEILHAKLIGSVSRTLSEQHFPVAGSPVTPVSTEQGQSDQNLSTAVNGTVPCQPQLDVSMSADQIFVSATSTLRADQDQVERKQKLLARPMYRQDIFYSGSIMRLPEFQSNPDVASYIKSVTSVPDEENVPPEKRGTLWHCVRMFKAMVDTFKQMMDFSLLLNPVFTIYGLCCLFTMGGFFIPFMYLPDKAIGHGVERGRAAFLVSIIGIANTVARVAVGWVSDRPWADSLVINNAALIIGGVATMLCPFCTSFGLLATYCCIFGISVAAFVSLRSIIMVELLGLEKLTNSFGLVTLCQGLSAFVGAPIAGALFDMTGTYHLSFYLAGASLALAGIICIPLRRLARWQRDRERKSQPQMIQMDEYTNHPQGQAV